MTSLAVALGRDARTTPLSASVGGQGEETFAQERFTTALPPLNPLSQPAVGTFVGEGPAGATYVYGRDMPARKLKVEHQPGDALRFSFQGLAGTAPSTGSIQGSLAVRDGPAVFDDAASDCHLSLTFYGPQLVVTQRRTCGFGNGVTATGRNRQST